MKSKQLKVDEVIQIANMAAQEAGYNLSEFKKPKAYFGLGKKDQTWTVFYDGKILKHGNHFLVWVNDITRKTQVMPGE
jgi:hypothetical protein